MTREQQNAVLERAKDWPSEQLEEAVEILLALESRAKGIYRLSDEERAGVRRGLEEQTAAISRPMKRLPPSSSAFACESSLYQQRSFRSC